MDEQTFFNKLNSFPLRKNTNGTTDGTTGNETINGNQTEEKENRIDTPASSTSQPSTLSVEVQGLQPTPTPKIELSVSTASSLTEILLQWRKKAAALYGTKVATDNVNIVHKGRVYGGDTQLHMLTCGTLSTLFVMPKNLSHSTTSRTFDMTSTTTATTTIKAKSTRGRGSGARSRPKKDGKQSGAHSESQKKATKSRGSKVKSASALALDGSTTKTPTEVATVATLMNKLSEAVAEKERAVAAKKEFETQNMKFRDTIEELIVHQTVQENQSAREKYLHNIQRLGWASAVRAGLQQVHESWNDGSAFNGLRERLKLVESSRKKLEEQRKKLNKMKPRKTTDESGTSSSKSHSTPRLSEEVYNMRNDILQLNLISKKTESENLKTQLRALLRERNLHIREMKRITDEDNAKYRDLPIKLKARYMLMSLLGKGGFSEVYKAYDLEFCRFVACKVHQLNPHWNDSKKENYVKHATREYNIHKNLHNPHVVELYDVFEIDANSFCTVLEYCPGQDLDFLLKQEHRLTEREARNKILQITAALKYLNSVKPPVIHYDLKPANVLLHDGEVKLTDFGLSKQVHDTDAMGNMELTSQGAGTYWYLPPECFVISSKPPKISSRVDVWSVGVIFFQCLYGQKPFGNQESQQMFLHNNTIQRAQNLLFPDKPKVSDDAKNFIRMCLTYDASTRPTVLEMCQHSYLTSKKIPK
eukprot:m.88147 g.88147  ORF g.88147 m.88147 type:complete len:703 (-) comp12260_c1_seq3:4716-6824(-)